MALELDPPDAHAQAAVAAALALAPLPSHPSTTGYSRPWRLAALLEAVDREPCGDERYTPSPRNTRGATRA